MIRTVQVSPDKEHFADLQMAVHKIAGSAGSFGYTAVSLLCKRIDSEIGKKISSEDFDDTSWLSSLDTFLTQLQKDFQVTTPQESTTKPPSFSHSPTSQPLLYVVDDDIKFLDLLERIKNQFTLELKTEFHPQKALDELSSTNFNPDALVVSQKYQISSITGFDLIEVQKSKQQHPPTLFGLFLEEDNLNARIETTEQGIDYVFHKPVSANELLKAMQEALTARVSSQAKVLIVDDDIDFCRFVTGVLSEIGMTVRSIHESEELFSTLESFQPNILLLDIVLPKYDGFNLLKTLRQDVEYQNLTIIIVTSSEEKITREKAYAANADDIMYKPLNKTLLQKRILNLASRSTAAIELPEMQNYTGLPNLTSLISNLKETLASSTHVAKHLVLFEVYHFSDLTKKNEDYTAKDLMISISNQLQWEADHKMKCFSYSATLFAVIVNDSDILSVERRMNKFLISLVQNETKTHISFNCAIAPISNQFGGAQQVLQAAEKGLHDAQRQPSAPVRLVKILPKGESIAKKEVVIIDDDKELLRILKQAFEAHELLVHAYSEGEDALKLLLSYTENHLPALIIAERKLPDMDGMDIYTKLKERFRTSVPFYILTVFSSDKDVSEGLKQGVLEYIVKPFNIALLMQKALKVIYRDG